MILGNIVLFSLFTAILLQNFEGGDEDEEEEEEDDEAFKRTVSEWLEEQIVVEDELGHQINEEELVEEEKEFVIDEFIWWANQGEFMSYEYEPDSVEVLCADLQCTDDEFKGIVMSSAVGD